jgi:hypothetical protein
MKGDVFTTDDLESGRHTRHHQFLFDFPPKRVGIPIEEDRLRPRFPSKFLQLLDSISPPNHQPASDSGQVLGERR